MPPTVADQLLDAQVAHVLAAVTGAALRPRVRHDAEELWAIASRIRLDQILSAEDVTRLITQLLGTVPASVTASTMLQVWTDVGLDGPPVVTRPADLIDRDHVGDLLSEALAGRRLLDGQADRLAESPQVGALASRFISRIVVEAVQANRAVAERIPGVGSIMSLGTSAASVVAGVADRPLQVMGDTAGKGAAMAVRRLRTVVGQTLDDPLFAAAVMEAWDLWAGQPIDGVDGEEARAAVHRVVGVLQQIAIEAVGTPQAQAGVAVVVQSFFDVYGEHPPTTLLEEMGIECDAVVTALEDLVPPIVEALVADGTVEVLVRARLEPFFHSPAVAAILDRAT